MMCIYAAIANSWYGFEQSLKDQERYYDISN